MKRFGNGVIFMVFLLCAAVVMAGTDEKKKLLKTTAVSVQAGAPAGLPPTIKIDPKLLLKGKLSLQIKTLSSAFYSAWNIVGSNYNFLCSQIPLFEEKMNLYRAKCEECKNKTYTDQEMAAAGCLPTDTLADCSQKLYRKCVGPYEVDILAMLVNFGSLSLYSKKAEEEFFNSILGKK